MECTFIQFPAFNTRRLVGVVKGVLSSSQRAFWLLALSSVRWNSSTMNPRLGLVMGVYPGTKVVAGGGGYKAALSWKGRHSNDSGRIASLRPGVLLA